MAGSALVSMRQAVSLHENGEEAVSLSEEENAVKLATDRVHNIMYILNATVSNTLNG